MVTMDALMPSDVDDRAVGSERMKSQEMSTSCPFQHLDGSCANCRPMFSARGDNHRTKNYGP